MAAPTSPQDLLRLMPYSVELGMRLEVAEPDRVLGSLEWAPQRCTAGGLLHGGALMSLADSVGGACAYLNLPEGAATSTVASSTSFLRGLRKGTAHAEAQPIHVGRTLIVVTIDVTDDDGRPLAHITQTQAVIAGA